MTKFRFEEGSYASNIIYHTALAVYFPWKSLNLIPGSHTIVLRTIRSLKESGYLLVKWNGKQKSIKITKKAIDVLDQIRPGLRDYYMFNSENHTFRSAAANNKAAQFQMISRKHRVAEAYCMCNMVGCRVLFNEKPKLGLTHSDEDLSEWLDVPIFYSSREIKTIDSKQAHKTEFSRIIGFLISQGGFYNIYNIHNGLIKWNQYGENKAKVLTSDIIRANFSSVFGKYEESSSDSAIMFAEDFSATELFLSSTGSRPDTHGFELISFDNTYADIYLLPLNMYGALQLKIITSPNWHDRLVQCLFGEIPKRFMASVDCDNYINGKYVLSILDGNIARLRRFNQSIYGGSPSEFEIICFPWQTETIKNVLDFDINIVQISTEQITTAFFS